MVQDDVNPGIFPLLLFGYLLGVLGVDLLVTSRAAGALVFAIFVASIGETIGGIWEISQGETYLGTVVTTFGIWLIGLFLFETVERALGFVTPEALGIYFLVLLVPITLLAIPAVRNSIAWEIRGAFVALFSLVLFAGLNFLYARPIFGVVAGASAWLSALCIWLLAAKDIFAIGTPTGEEEIPQDGPEISKDSMQ